jgi:HEAT repeat protein
MNLGCKFLVFPPHTFHAAAMNKRVKIALSVLLVALLSVTVWQILRAREPMIPDPVCQGKPLREWLNNLDPQTRELSASAAEALRQMGTNAVPRLLKEAAAHDSIVKGLMMHLLRQQSLLKLRFETSSDHQAKGLRGFHALGTTGAVALAQGLTNSNKWIRHGCVGQWEMVKEYPEILFQPLMNCLKDSEPMVRARSANALGVVGQQPDRVVPALMELLDDPDDWVRSMAALGLSLFGDRAKLALPTLLQHLTNCTSQFRYFGTNALRAISPAAADKAGVK